jgi:hypothetical protein
MVFLQISIMRDPFMDDVKRATANGEVLTESFGKIEVSDISLVEISESLGVPGTYRRPQYTVMVRGSRQKGYVKVLVMKSIYDGSMLGRPEVFQVRLHGSPWRPALHAAPDGVTDQRRTT